MCPQSIGPTVPVFPVIPPVYSGWVKWRWWQRKASGPQWRVRSRATGQTASRVDLGAIIPTAADLLAHACASALLVAGEYGRVARDAWSARDRDELVRAEAAVLGRYDVLRGVLAEYSEDPIEALAGPLSEQSELFSRMSADRWYERVGTCYVVGGFLSDFYRVLASGLPATAQKDIIDTIDNSEPEALVAGVLGRIIAVDQAHAWRLSLWSRRLVGDTMLVARAVLRKEGEQPPGAETYEPVFTDVITEHTRRLDRLGLTA